MKKYLGAMISGLVGILTFVFLSIPQFVMSSEMMDIAEKKNAWDFFDADAAEAMSEINGFGFYKFAVIALAIVAGLLIVCAAIMLLKNVLKLKFNLNMINNIVLAAFAVLAVCALIALFVIKSDMMSMLSELAMGADISEMISINPGIGAWFNVVIGVVGCAAGWLFARKAD